jgi:hypothetical protein
MIPRAVENKLAKIYDQDYLKKVQNIGMSKVDPADIRPPSILLVQKSSDLSLFQDVTGNQPKIGQYFDTGKLEIMDSFEAYILLAAKSKYVDKIKPEEGEKDQYKAIGMRAEDLSLFQITFKSSSLYTLSGLFTTTVASKRPMFSIKVKFETKELKNEKGSWIIPVLRIIGSEEDIEKLKELERNATMLDLKAEEIVRRHSEELDEQGIKEVFDRPAPNINEPIKTAGVS